MQQVADAFVLSCAVAPGHFRNQQLGKAEENASGEHEYREDHTCDDAEDGQRVCNCQRKPFWYQHMLQGGNAGFGRICQGKGPGRLQHPAAHGGAFSFGDMLPDRQRRQHQQRQAAAHGAAENHAPAGPPRIAARPEVQTDQGDGHGKELLRNLHDG